MAGVKSSGNSYKCSGTNGTFSRRFLSAKFPLKNAQTKATKLSSPPKPATPHFTERSS